MAKTSRKQPPSVPSATPETTPSLISPCLCSRLPPGFLESSPPGFLSSAQPGIWEQSDDGSDFTTRESVLTKTDSPFSTYQTFREDATACGSYTFPRPPLPPRRVPPFRSPNCIINPPPLRTRRDSGVTTISIPASEESTDVPGNDTRLSSPASIARPKSYRHSQFYFTDNLVTFDVEGCLLRVHRSMLEKESGYFRDVFARNAGRGQNDETPIHLWRISLAGFEALLRYLYHGVYDDKSYTLDDWIVLLSIATDLSFSKLRVHAIEKLRSPTINLDAVERIVLAGKYNILEWLAPAYTDLCVRDGALREPEAQTLGAKTTAQIAEVRERVLLDIIEHYQTHSLADSDTVRKLRKRSPDMHRVSQIVQDVFWPEGPPTPSCTV